MDDVALFLLTMPSITGPGTNSIAIAIGASRPSCNWAQVTLFFGDASMAALAIALIVWAAYASADRPAACSAGPAPVS